MWVDANFKEGQLRNIRIGQPVTLEADVYGNKVEYHGTVDGLGAGTGAAFALLPAQNATGNWIKVVQRVPVRVALDPAQLAEHPLRVGLSMEAQVDVSDRTGKTLAERRAQRAGGADAGVRRRSASEADARRATHHRRQPRPSAQAPPTRTAAGRRVASAPPAALRSRSRAEAAASP